MKDKLSTGKTNTWGSYREECVKLFGEDSEAVKSVDEQIEKHGIDALVEAKENQMVGMLAMLDFWGRGIT